jgi:hypothetical protein
LAQDPEFVAAEKKLLTRLTATRKEERGDKHAGDYDSHVRKSAKSFSRKPHENPVEIRKSVIRIAAGCRALLDVYLRFWHDPLHDIPAYYRFWIDFGV